MLFEWDESKRQANLAKHLIDFQDATRVFDGPVFEKAQRRHGEDWVFSSGPRRRDRDRGGLRYARQMPADYFG